MTPSETRSWFLRCATATAAVLLACAAATALLGSGPQLPLTTRDRNITVIDRFINGSRPDAVLLGSSVSVRLSEAHFGRIKLRNLALDGGAATTGLEILATARQLPPVILVETNVLSRPADRELVAHYASRTGTQPWFFRPIRVAVASYEEWRHAPPSHADVAEHLQRLLSAPPASFDNRAFVQRARQESEITEEPATRSTVERLKQLIPALEARGTRVLLIELPQADEIENAPYGVTTRRIVREAFPESARWLVPALNRSDLRWPDGVHMDERSALLVARAIEDRLR